MSYAHLAIAAMSSDRISASWNRSISAYDDRRPAPRRELAVLPQHTELEAEPEHPTEQLERFSGGRPLRCLPGALVEIGQRRLSQCVRVPDHLVHHIRLRRVIGHRVVTDVLGGEEAPIGQCAVERSGRDQARYWFDADTRSAQTAAAKPPGAAARDRVAAHRAALPRRYAAQA